MCNFSQARLHVQLSCKIFSSSSGLLKDALAKAGFSKIFLKENSVFGLNATICQLKTDSFLAASALLPESLQENSLE